MRSAILKALLIIVPILVLSCKKEETEDPLIVQLQNTSWKYDKLVIAEINGNIKLTIHLDTTILCNETWTFKDHNRINVISDNYGEGCGEWIVKNQKLFVSIALGQVIQDFCHPDNFQGYIHFSEMATMQDDRLVLSDYYTLSRLISSGDLNHENYELIMDDYIQNKIVIKTYLKPENIEVISNEECCGRISWFFGE